ncbi:MAG: 50S ribosomal protein L5 [Patescibacteria group bacterium]
MNLQQQYQKEIQSVLQKELGISNVMAVPKLVKIVVNVGLGEALSDSKVLDKVCQQITVVTGQKPIVTRAKQAISAFKLRAGDKVGVKVTLRGKRMYDFFQKLVSIGLPRLRDFRGIPKESFDGRGNYSLGLQEQTVFPEIDFGQIDKMRGLEITFVTSARNNEYAFALLTHLGLPFAKEGQEKR